MPMVLEPRSVKAAHLVVAEMRLDNRAEVVEDEGGTALQAAAKGSLFGLPPPSLLHLYPHGLLEQFVTCALPAWLA
jgi:hypothetical protein